MESLGELGLFLLALILIFGFEAISSFVLIIIPLNFIFGAIGGIVASNQKKRY